MSRNIDKIIPNNKEAEDYVIGSILVDPAVLSNQLVGLRPEHFFSNNNRKIFKACLDIQGDGSVIDIITVSDYLDSKNELNEIGRPYINDLALNVISSANCPYYADIVLKSYYNRKIITIADRIINLAYDKNNPDVIVAEAVNDFCRITETKEDERFYLPDNPSLLSDLIQKKRDNPDQFLGLNTGFTEIDRQTGGFMRGDLICIGAGTSVGKTALAVNIAYNALCSGKAVTYFSLEMPAEQIMARLAAIHSSLNVLSFKTGIMSEEDLNKVKEAEEGIYKYLNFTIYPRPCCDVNYINAKLMSDERRLRGMDLVIIDHIHLMEGNGDDGYSIIKNITRNLKGLAMTYNVPIIMLSQLNRNIGEKPELRNLRESGSIEQDSNIVMLLHRSAKDSHRMEIDIAKNRDGPTGKLILEYIPYCTKFINSRIRLL